MSNYLSQLNRGSRSAFNYSLLIANCSFPQGYVNPPIRGSIEELEKKEEYKELKESQSPYKGFNRKSQGDCELGVSISLNPPIRGSIEQDNALFENYNHKR